VALTGVMSLESNDVTHLLKAWSGGDQGALEELTPKVYVELRRMAAKYMRNERADDFPTKRHARLEDGQGVAYGRARALKMSTCLSCLARVQVANSWFVGKPKTIQKRASRP